METNVKNFDEICDGILSAGKTPTDSASIGIQKENLRIELQEAFEQGSVSDVMRIRQMLTVMPALEKAARLRELREELNTLPEQFNQLKAAEAKIIEERAGPAERLAKLADEMQIVGNEIARFEMSLGLVDNDRKILEGRRRELKFEIQTLMTALSKETEDN